MSAGAHWQQLVSAALMGTQRRPYQPAPLDGLTGDLIENVNGMDAGERALARAIAVSALQRKAGRLPARGAPVEVPPSPPDARRRCSPQAGACLEQILANGRSSLLLEWLELARQHGLRAREPHLPLLLEQPDSPATRALLLSALGERGQWLAARNPAWRSYAVLADERTWHEGQRRERLAFLTDLRERDPQRARELLAGSWSQDAPSERLTFLPVLMNRLSMADEPFLESVLSDTRKDVRQSAALLLARLPEARLVARMSARARGLLAWKSGLLRSTLEISLPERCDEDLLRDGIEPRLPAGARFGEKAWWLAQILAVVPPRTWCNLWNKRPTNLLEAIRKHEWEAALLHGWTEAAVLHQDQEWLEALLEHEARRNEGKGMLALFGRLPPALKEKVMLNLLREQPSLSYDAPSSICLAACRHPWSPELTQAVTTAIGWALQKGDLQPWRWEKLMREIPAYFHPEQIEAALARIGAALAPKTTPDPFVNQLLAVLEFRQEMQRAFQTQEPE